MCQKREPYPYPQCPFWKHSRFTHTCVQPYLQVFEQTCAPLVNDTTNHEQATALLNNLWTASNTAEKLLWQAQLDADELEVQATHQLEAEQLVLREAEAQKEKEDLHKEECKKNQTKFLPIPDRPVPQKPPIIASQSAT